MTDATKAERAAIIMAFRNLFASAPDLSIVQVAGALEDLSRADPPFFNMLRGGYLLNDIFAAARDEKSHREAEYAKQN